MDDWAERNRDHHDANASDYETNVRPNWMPNAVFAFKKDIQPHLEALPRHARIADVGCGPGDFISELFAMGFTNIEAIDISQEMLRIAKERHPSIGMTLADATNIPHSDCSFDFINVKGCLHHIKDTGAALREIYRCLAPSGVFRLQEPNADSFITAAAALRDATPDQIERPLSLERVQTELEKIGFQVELCKTYLHFETASTLRHHGIDNSTIDTIFSALNPTFDAAKIGEIFLLVCRKP